MKPTIYVYGETIPEAWERSIVQLEHLGALYPGRYYTPAMETGRHATMVMRIERFCAEPRVHKGFTMEPADFLAYRDEIMRGSDRKWDYTYYDRIHNNSQLYYAIACMERKPDTHKAVITLGRPEKDAIYNGEGTHIPCLREIHFELEQDGDAYRLNTYMFWRARDAMHAALANLFGLSFLAESVVAALNMRQHINRQVKCGGCIDTSSDYHVNGKDWNYARTVIGKARQCNINERSWTTKELEDIVYG